MEKLEKYRYGSWRAKEMDVIAGLPGCAGQAADAVSAYTQVKMENAPSLFKIPKSECPDIWIRLSKHKWPKSWSDLEKPGVLLERNLYGHPLAGLLRKFYWNTVGEKFFWECLLVNRARGLFLSVCVDHIKMAGIRWRVEVDGEGDGLVPSRLQHSNPRCHTARVDGRVKRMIRVPRTRQVDVQRQDQCWKMVIPFVTWGLCVFLKLVANWALWIDHQCDQFEDENFVEFSIAQQRYHLLWLVLLVQRHEDTSQEGVKNSHLCLQFLRVELMERGHHGNDVKVSDEDGFLSCSMMIKAKNIIMKERIWINRVAQRDHVFSILHPDTVRLRWAYHLQFERNPVCTWILPARCHRWKTVVAYWTATLWDSLSKSVEDIPGVWIYSRSSRLHVRMSKKSNWNYGCDPPSQVPFGKSTHMEIHDVGRAFFVSFNGVVQCTVDYTGHDFVFSQSSWIWFFVSRGRAQFVAWLKASRLNSIVALFISMQHWVSITSDTEQCGQFRVPRNRTSTVSDSAGRDNHFQKNQHRSRTTFLWDVNVQ